MSYEQMTYEQYLALNIGTPIAEDVYPTYLSIAENLLKIARNLDLDTCKSTNNIHYALAHIINYLINENRGAYRDGIKSFRIGEFEQDYEVAEVFYTWIIKRILSLIHI